MRFKKFVDKDGKHVWDTNTGEIINTDDIEELLYKFNDLADALNDIRKEKEKSWSEVKDEAEEKRDQCCRVLHKLRAIGIKEDSDLYQLIKESEEYYYNRFNNSYDKWVAEENINQMRGLE